MGKDEGVFGREMTLISDNQLNRPSAPASDEGRTVKSEAFNIDCMVAMAEMPDKAFDLAIVDPPYGIYQNAHRPSSTTKLAKTQAYNNAVYKQDIPSERYFDELRRTASNQIIWGGNYFLDHLGATRSMIVWDKKTKETNWADAELAWTSFDDIVRIFSFGWNGMLQEDMANKERRIHPTQKPVALYKWLLTNYAKPGDTILDTHLGSGSSRIAAHDLGFDFTGFELDRDYFDAQERRFADHIAQPKLFAPEPVVEIQEGLFVNASDEACSTQRTE